MDDYSKAFAGFFREHCRFPSLRITNPKDCPCETCQLLYELSPHGSDLCLVPYIGQLDLKKRATNLFFGDKWCTICIRDRQTGTAAYCLYVLRHNGQELMNGWISRKNDTWSFNIPQLVANIIQTPNGVSSWVIPTATATVNPLLYLFQIWRWPVLNISPYKIKMFLYC